MYHPTRFSAPLTAVPCHVAVQPHAESEAIDADAALLDEHTITCAAASLAVAVNLSNLAWLLRDLHFQRCAVLPLHASACSSGGLLVRGSMMEDGTGLFFASPGTR
jgi:hypothetical protein